MRRTFVAAALALLVVAVAHADYKDTFRKAIQARNRGRWADVVRYMREAISEQSRETGERINISGMDFVPYVPHYFLGLALFNGGDCVGALASWQVSESQGTVTRLPEGGNLVKLRKQCETKLAAAGGAKPPPADKLAAPDAAVVAAINTAVQNAESAIARAENAERAVGPLETDLLLSKVWKTEAALGNSEQRARDALVKARGDLDAGRRESALSQLQEASTLAGTAADLFDAVRQHAQRRRDELRAADENAARPNRTDPAARVAVPIAPGALKPGDATAKPATVPAFSPPPALAAAAGLFFSARYQEAATSLSRQSYPTGPAAAQAALLRSASYYSLYLISGERDTALLDQAQQAAGVARTVAPTLRPDARAFSPRFIEFYARPGR